MNCLRNMNCKYLMLAFALLSLSMPASSTLSCEVAAACGYTTMFRISDPADGHAELANESNYNNLVCCRELNNYFVGTGCTGIAATIIKLSGNSNAHAEMSNESNYNVNACINTTASGVSVGYDTSCSSYDTCVASISGNSNAHVGNCTAYSTKVCATANINPVEISFVSPTEPNRVMSDRNYTYVNVSTINASSVYVDWNNSLIGYWNFDNGTADLSSYNNNGSNNGADCSKTTLGRILYACRFDGINDYVSVSAGNFSNSSATLEAWISMNNNNAANNYTIFSTPSQVSNTHTGLLALWHFSENSTASGGVKDSSPWGNNGTASGAYFNSSGRFGTAWSFSGSDYISVGDIATMDGIDAITVAGWFKSSYQGGYVGGLITKLGDSPQEAWQLNVEPTPYFDIKNSVGGNYVSGTRPLNDSKWHFMAGTYDRSLSSGRLKLYVDGILINQTNGDGSSIPATTAGVYIGARERNSIDIKFNGIIDEVAVWNRSLSAEEVRDLYLGGLSMHKQADNLRFVAGNISLSYNVSSWSGWHYIAGTYTQSNATFYADGIQVNSSSNRGLVVLGGSAYIGGMFNSTDNLTFNGTIDEVRAWNRALSAREINASYNASARLERNFTDLNDGVYNYYAVVVGAVGNRNVSETRNVTVRLVTPLITGGNNSVVGTENYQSSNLTVTFYQPSVNSYAGSVKGRIWVETNAGAFDGGHDCTSNSNGNCTVEFLPSCGYTSGSRRFRGGVFGDSVYNLTNSTDGFITIDTTAYCLNKVSFSLEFNISDSQNDHAEVDNKTAGLYRPHQLSNYYACLEDTSLANSPAFGIVFSGSTLDYINLTAGNSHMMKMSQHQTGNKFLIPATKNGCTAIRNKMNIVQAFGIMTQAFASTGAGGSNPIEVVLSYPGMDIIGNITKSGAFTMNIEKNESSGIVQMIFRD